MPNPRTYLFQDAVEQLCRYSGGAKPASVADLIRAPIEEAYEELSGALLWTHYQRHRRVRFSETFDDGTITYVHSTRTLTFTDAPPSWVAEGRIKIDDEIHDIESYSGSGNDVVLDEHLNPGADISTATTFSLRRQDYQLPGDTRLVWRFHDQGGIWRKAYISADELLEHERFWDIATTFAWTLLHDPDRQGGIRIRFLGYPDDTTSLDYICQVNPRELIYTGYEDAARTGTVTITGTGVEGAGGTAFASDMVGSYLRVAADGASESPAGKFSSTNRYTLQARIKSVTDSNTLVLESSPGNVTSRRYRISCPLDLPAHGRVFEAFWRCAEWKRDVLNRSMGGKDGTSWTAYREALKRAMGDEGNLYVVPVNTNGLAFDFYNGPLIQA